MVTVTKTSRRRRADGLRNEQTVRAAARRIFERYGKKISMDQVAMEAGVSRGTVYATFPSREHLVEEVSNDLLGEAVLFFREALNDPDPWIAIVRCLMTPAVAVAVTKDMLDPDGPLTPAKQATLECGAALDQLLAKAKRTGVVREEIRIEQIDTLFRGLYNVLPDDERDSETVQQYVRIILHGVTTNAWKNNTGE